MIRNFSLFFLLILVSGCSVTNVVSSKKIPKVESFKYQVDTQPGGKFVTFEIVFNKHTKTASIDAAWVASDGITYFDVSCDRYEKNCLLFTYDFSEYNAKKSITIVDRFYTSVEGDVMIMITVYGKDHSFMYKMVAHI